ncbi:GNAT family N-acetyltransferase [Neptunicella marina]|uniref:GNAT family N-acetyltransferase n=1 Tax=Neptunicella marina TaxID=2125989 RepID=A0A8J6IX27_9ALTE|nr:GNAT family N-acetyltransferase [Neptunicella marina]MBC3767130.1 GNAT family N-acetyltransferase [Neptunicella marina]
MIKKLEHVRDQIAQQIHQVFQRSYKIEADIIGVENFPPLLRSIENIQQSDSQFYAYLEDGCVAGVIEIVFDGIQLDIDSLVVDPDHFRKGIAGKLIRFVLDSYEHQKAVVETAVVNIPAIDLYKKHGFVEFKQWVPSHGIPKVALSIE